MDFANKNISIWNLNVGGSPLFLFGNVILYKIRNYKVVQNNFKNMEVDTENLRELARFAEENGMGTKGSTLRGLADEVELHDPLIEALRKERDEREEFDRGRLEETIEELER